VLGGSFTSNLISPLVFSKLSITALRLLRNILAFRQLRVTAARSSATPTYLSPGSRSSLFDGGEKSPSLRTLFNIAGRCQAVRDRSQNQTAEVRQK